MSRLLLVILLFLLIGPVAAQDRPLFVERFTKDLKISETAPAELLSTRSLVLFENSYKIEELNKIQSAFQQIGIDADFYLDIEKVLAGMDTERAFATYFTIREIHFIILLSKTADGYTFHATEYNKTSQFVTPQQPAWKVTDRKIEEFLMKIYRDSWLREKKQNFLINDQPEMDVNVPIIAGRRSDLFPIDLKIDQIAIPRIADAGVQSEVDTLFKKLYPYPERYKVVASVPADEKELTKQGFQYLLLYVRCNGKMAHEILGYNMANSASAYGSVTYPNGTPQVKTISADVPVYKFYIKHLRSGNIFLGTKWDADETLVQSLKNHIMGFRTELKLN
jgi:hypothetical protein